MTENKQFTTTNGLSDKSEAGDKVEIPSFFMSDIMKVLSELECEIWDNRVPKDKVKMQNLVSYLKSELVSISKHDRAIITLDGLKYKRVYE